MPSVSVRRLEEECSDCGENLVEIVEQWDPFPDEDESPFEAVGLKIKETAFNKSVSERGAKGDVPVLVKFGDEPSTEIDFLIVQEKEGEVVEAKVLQVSVVLPISKSVEAPEEGRNEEAEEVETTKSEESEEILTQEEAQEEHEEETVDEEDMAGKSLDNSIATVEMLRHKYAQLCQRERMLDLYA